MQAIRFQLAPEAADLAPKRQHPDDAGYDLRARVGMTIAPGAFAAVPTGLRLELPEGWMAEVRPRSGLALRHGVTVLNAPGTIDAGYRGEVGVILANFGDAPFVVEKGMKVAQIVVARVEQAEIAEVQETDDTDRGTGGFGSTGL